MHTVLIVSRSFPPVGSTGASIRLIKFIKYIASLDWKFIVLTQHPEHTVVSEASLSTILESEIPPGTDIIRVKAPFSSKHAIESEASKNLSTRGMVAIWKKALGFVRILIGKLLDKIIPITSLWWGLRVFWQGWRVSRRQKIDLVFVVTPTFTNALAGILISCFARKPMVLDIKDDWVGSPDFYKKPSWRKAIETQLEGMIIRYAKRVTIVTEQSYHIYKHRYAKIKDANKFHYIPNGCDMDEYSILRNRETPEASDHFLIVSAAWGYQKNYRDITPFILALESFLHQSPTAKQHLEVLLLGNSLSSEYDDLLLQTGTKSLINVREVVVRKQLVEWLWKADLFLLVQPVGNTTAISGTLYEYWATGKAPILVIAEIGASSELVEKYHLGQCLNFKDINGIANYIDNIYQSHQRKQPKTIGYSGIEAFDRKNLAHHMANIWQECLKDIE